MSSKTQENRKGSRKQRVTRSGGTLRSDLFPNLCRASGLPTPVAETVFYPGRKFRWDWCWPEHRVALEVQGGIWVSGKHGRGSGLQKDFEKLSLAASIGWRVLLVEPKYLMTIPTMNLIRATLNWRAET